MSDFLYILNVVSPVFLLVSLGIILRYFKMVNDAFVSLTSKFVFNVSLPALVFLKLYKVDLAVTFDLPFVLFIVIATLFVFALSWLLSHTLVNQRKNKGVFIQGSFRSNYAIIGLAIVLGMFGDDAMVKASLLIPFLLPMYNVMSIVALTVYNENDIKLNIKQLAKEIVMNPLILGVIVALPFALMRWNIFPALDTTLDHLASIALPLALIGIGGSLNFEAIKRASRISMWSSLIKIVLAPAIVTLIALWMGFTGVDVGIIFIIFACPTAIASFVMAIGMGGSATITGNIIVLSTLGSLLTFTIGLYLLRLFGIS